tara:strand:+ start:576 stop:803 length:228 start_codon:yes stop_codon:yes gene_type:complete
MKKLKEVLYVGLGLAKETEIKLKEQYDRYLARGKREDKLDMVGDVFSKIKDTGGKIKENLEKRINTFLNLITPKR